MDRKGLGSFGEDKAADFLRKRGYRIVERNFSCRFGEVDIIARKGNFIVFAEVKLRKDASFAQAREFVTSAKQRRIISSAALWLSMKQVELQPRFDVIEVYAPDGENSKKISVNHIEDAFS